MKTLLKVLWFISGIYFLIIGCYCLFNTAQTLLSLAWFISFSILFHGVTSIITFFYIKDEFNSSWVLADGILSLIFGSLLLGNKSIAFMAAILPWAFSLWLLIAGIIRIIWSYEYKKSTGHVESIWMTAGILSLVCGIIMLFHPYLAAIVLSTTVGIYLIIIGCAFIALFSGFKKFNKILK